MSVNAHLTKVANAAVIDDREKQGIRTSLRAITTKINAYFGSEITEITVFGSFSRNTILPRYVDNKSDVDLMVVFNDNSLQPQTYLSKLSAFVAYYYKTSENKQSHPAIQLELNHIMFELVPAVQDWWGTYSIPDKASSWSNWQETDSTGFNKELTDRNVENSSLTKPLVRTLKYWNAYNGYPFESYDLERQILAHSPSIFYSYNNLGDYFYDCVEGLTAPSWSWPKVKTDKLNRLKSTATSAKNNEVYGYTPTAVQDINKIIPLK